METEYMNDQLFFPFIVDAAFKDASKRVLENILTQFDDLSEGELEWDLVEVKKELVKLQVPFMKSLTPEERKTVRLARVQSQEERLRPSIEKTLEKPNPNAETLTVEELQQLLLDEGVKLEDNIQGRNKQ
jgi:vacuolar-type H+-ATPase subunit I/STV1